MAITIGCCYCSRLFYSPPVTFAIFAAASVFVTLWSVDCVTEPPPSTLAVFAAASVFVTLWSIDCVTFAACANACCDCGIAPTPIKDIADSSTAAVANIAIVGHFRFFSAEFPVVWRFIVEVRALMVNMRYGLVFSIKIQNLKPNFIVMRKQG